MSALEEGLLAVGVIILVLAIVATIGSLVAVWLMKVK